MTYIKTKSMSLSKIRYASVLIICGICIAASLMASEEITDVIFETLSSSVRGVIPSVFPFMLISSFMTSYGISDSFAVFPGGILCKLFGIPPRASVGVTMGLISGFPVGASVICDLRRAGLLTDKEAEHALPYAHNTGPAFPVSFIGTYLWHSTLFGLAVYISQVLALTVLALADGNNKKFTSTNEPRHTKGKSLAGAVTCAVVSSARGCIDLVGFIVFFSLCAKGLSMLLPPHMSVVSSLIASVLEVSTGVSESAVTGGVIGAALTGFAVGFGGISALMQASLHAEAAGISFKRCVRIKFFQGIVTAVFCCVAYTLIFR